MYNLSFNSREEYRKFLQKHLVEISKNEDFNIFLHCVTTHTPYMLRRNNSKEQEIKDKISGIWKIGLDLNGAQDYGSYGSINGTARFMGDAQSVDLDRIINYDYVSHSKRVHSFIFAIPKWIDVDGETLEFSSYKDVMYKPSEHHKSCLFDVSKGRYMPTAFILACQEAVGEDEIFDITINDNHFAFLSQSDKEQITNGFAEKIKKVMGRCKDKYNTTNIKDVLDKMTDEHLYMIRDFLNEP